MNDDVRWMRAALSLARRGLGTVWPNPAVGCILVKDDMPIGRGWTQPGGRPHAEAEALRRAGQGARGATAYVTLEPCSHTGKTGPCADKLVEAGVARVVVACGDPDKRVAGKGIARLREAGIDVVEGVLEDEARLLNRGFILNRTAARPMVTLKLAMTLDGRIATKDGESQWITGPEARAEAHLLRASHDAIAVGRGTAEADDPALTVRLPGFSPDRNPVRVLFSAQPLKPGAKLRDQSQARTIRLCAHGREVPDDGIETRLVPSNDKELPAPAASLSTLAGIGITRLMIEGGGHLAAAFLRTRLVDEIVLFQAGGVLGGDARPGVANLSIRELTMMERYELSTVRRVGPDVMQHWIRPFLAEI